jgi:hypothetical protein
VIHAWGGKGQGYEWAESEHGIFVDSKGFVWLGGNGAKDSQILKFTQDGKFVLQSSTSLRKIRSPQARRGRSLSRGIPRSASSI